MKILVTGGDGMLALAIRNIYKPYGEEFTFCGKSQLDITDLGGVLSFFNRERFDIVINCAAYTNVEGAETNTEAAYAINETGAGNLAKGCIAMGALLIHISTDAVYDGTKNDVYAEDDACNPLSVYSKSKYAGELAIKNIQCQAIIIRTSWLYSLDKPNFVTAIINKAKALGALNVVYNQLGTPTWTYDLAHAILAITTHMPMHQAGATVYHYSNEGAISWYDFAVNICDLLSIDAHITPVPASQYPSKVNRPFQSILSKDKIKTTFGLTVPYWRQSLAKCLAAYPKS